MSLVHSGEHLNQFTKNYIVDDSAGALLIGLLYEDDVFLWDSIMTQQLPQHFPINTVKCLLIVHKGRVDGEFHSRECSTMILKVWQSDLYTTFPSGIQPVHPAVVCPTQLSISPGLSYSALFQQSI